MIAGGLKTIPLLTISALTTQTNKRNVVFQNEEGNGLCNADSLWLVCLHGNILLPQSHRGLRRYVRSFPISFYCILSCLRFRSDVRAEKDIYRNDTIKPPPFNKSSPLHPLEYCYGFFKEHSKKDPLLDHCGDKQRFQENTDRWYRQH